MEDNPVCGFFDCIYSNICEYFQLFGIAACSGHPVINPDGECPNFMCACCKDIHCSEWLEVPF